jgi:hypothetical protein
MSYHQNCFRRRDLTLRNRDIVWNKLEDGGGPDVLALPLLIALLAKA